MECSEIELDDETGKKLCWLLPGVTEMALLMRKV